MRLSRAISTVVAASAISSVALTSAWSGTFTTEITGGGRYIKIENTPTAANADCNDIALAKTLKMTESNEDGTMPVVVAFDQFVDSAGNPNLGPNGPKHMKDDAIADGTVVDHKFCEKDPYQNGNDKQDYPPATRGLKKPGMPIRSSFFNDGPNIFLPVLGKPKVKADFEVCAYCMDTVPATSLNECMTWTYMNSQANGPSIMVTGGTGAGNARPPSQSHKDALTKFNNAHAPNNTKCPEKDAADAQPGPPVLPPAPPKPKDVNPKNVPPFGCGEGCEDYPALSAPNLLLLIGLFLTAGVLLAYRSKRLAIRSLT